MVSVLQESQNHRERELEDIPIQYKYHDRYSISRPGVQVQWLRTDTEKEVLIKP